MKQPPRKHRDRSRLAPSIQRAHRRVRRALIASVVHGVLLLALGIVLLTGTSPRWIPGLLALGGAIVVPLLGRAAYYGNSLAGLLLLLSALVPIAAALLVGWNVVIPAGGIVFVPFYYAGARGAIGLRGRRRSKRN